MRSYSRLALGLNLVAALTLGGCWGAPVVTASANSCSSLLPSEWRKPVTGIPLPGLDATVGDLWIALDGQTGKLDVANDRTASSIGIIERCESRDKIAIERATRRKFLGIF
jgi:hypothetical protein